MTGTLANPMAARLHARNMAGTVVEAMPILPPIAILLGWLILAETPPLLAIPGGLLCLTGAWLARR